MVILETERLLFRSHQADDLEAYCAMEMDPEVRRYLGGARLREAAERRFWAEVEANASHFSGADRARRAPFVLPFRANAGLTRRHGRVLRGR